MNDPISPKNNKPLMPVSPVIIIIALIAVVLGGWISAHFFNNPDANRAQKNLTIKSGTFLNTTRSLSDFKLTDHSEAAFTPQSLKGKWSFLFFGYTHCPDVCPNTLTVLKVIASQLEKTMPKIANSTQTIFVSVDPERDTPKHLKQFVQYFNQRFIGVTGPHVELQKLTKQLGILYAIGDIDNKDKNKKNYLVDHSAHILLFNPQGHFQALFSYPHDARKLLKDYQLIRKHVGN